MGKSDPSRKLGNTISRQIPKGMLTRSQLAREVGVSIDTIKRWRQLNVLPATCTLQTGKVTVYLYDRVAVEKAKLLKRKTGPLSQRL